LHGIVRNNDNLITVVIARLQNTGVTWRHSRGNATGFDYLGLKDVGTNLYGLGTLLQSIRILFEYFRGW